MLHQTVLFKLSFSHSGHLQRPNFYQFFQKLLILPAENGGNWTNYWPEVVITYWNEMNMVILIPTIPSNSFLVDL